MTTPSGQWNEVLDDPFRAEFPRDGPPDLEAMLRRLPRPQGEPALDPEAVARACERLAGRIEVNLGHPLLDCSVLVGLASIDLTFEGRHPMYGRGKYGYPRHDGFPPTIIAAVDTLLGWGLDDRALELLLYYLERFVNRKGGEILHYGPSLAEYGQLVELSVRVIKRFGLGVWPAGPRRCLTEMVGRLMTLEAEAGADLIGGVPEADERDRPGRYFHNNAWVSRGLAEWAELAQAKGLGEPAEPSRVRIAADALAERTLRAIREAWPADPSDWWLVPTVEPAPRPANLRATRLASYTNYRYWPELLSSGLLPPDLANRAVEARRAGGGEFMGATRFLDRLDDWPLYDYLLGLWRLGRRNDFLYTLYGHVAFHQGEGHLTAYEQVSLPPGRKVTDYCLPCQLVAARAAVLLRSQNSEAIGRSG